MNLILTMAGLYERFRGFSYEIPKYLLPLSNRTILHHVLKPFDESLVFNRVLLVANKQDLRFRSQVERTLDEFNFKMKYVIFIDSTEGQSDTASEGLAFLLKQHNFEKSPVVVHNIDTILLNRDFSLMEKESKSSECVVDVFSGSNEAYSYVLKNGDHVSTIIEKKVVSNMASSGCYLFTHPDSAFLYLNKSSNHYISDSIMKMVKDGHHVKTTPTRVEGDTFVMGTPEEYINSMSVFDLTVHG
jgi:NDP-sugar pyrophosphorylase family protein